jgi:hypothetical protein
VPPVFAAGDEFRQRRVLAKAAILDRQVDLAQVHRHHPAGADIGVADLGIAHLPARQADIGAMGDQRRMRAGRPSPVEIGRAACTTALPRARVQAPAIEDAQDDGFGDMVLSAFFLTRRT